jgi:hypothetical protein
MLPYWGQLAIGVGGCTGRLYGHAFKGKPEGHSNIPGTLSFWVDMPFVPVLAFALNSYMTGNWQAFFENLSYALGSVVNLQAAFHL